MQRRPLAWLLCHAPCCAQYFGHFVSGASLGVIGAVGLCYLTGMHSGNELRGPVYITYFAASALSLLGGVCGLLLVCSRLG